MPTIRAEKLQQLSKAILIATGASEHDATIVSGHLVAANLAGHDSHGIMRTLQYVKEIESGQIDPSAQLQILEDWNGGAVLDASGLFGQVACHDAMCRAIEKARSATSGAVTIRHANHSGRLGTYVEMAAEAGMIGLAMANGGGAGQWVAPFGGRERRLSTNPLAIAAPSAGPFPFVLDISTSVAPEGKVRDYLQRQRSVPDGWLVDHQGKPTNDAQTLYADPGGALLPFGGSAGHKGFGLAFMVDVFAGALSAAGCPCSNADPANGTGLFLLALDVERFLSMSEFTQRLQDFAAYVKSSQPAAGFEEVLVPGEFEHRQRLRRIESGIEVPDLVWNQLKELAERLGVLSTQEFST